MKFSRKLAFPPACHSNNASSTQINRRTPRRVWSKRCRRLRNEPLRRCSCRSTVAYRTYTFPIAIRQKPKRRRKWKIISTDEFPATPNVRRTARRTCRQKTGRRTMKFVCTFRNRKFSPKKLEYTQNRLSPQSSKQHSLS